MEKRQLAVCEEHGEQGRHRRRRRCSVVMGKSLGLEALAPPRAATSAADAASRSCVRRRRCRPAQLQKPPDAAAVAFDAVMEEREDVRTEMRLFDESVQCPYYSLMT
jgi:hypothetical protein